MSKRSLALGGFLSISGACTQARDSGPTNDEPRPSAAAKAPDRFAGVRANKATRDCVEKFPHRALDDLGDPADVGSALDACKAAHGGASDPCNEERFMSRQAARCLIEEHGSLTKEPMLRFKDNKVAWCEERLHERTQLPQWICVEAITGEKLGPAVRVINP